MAPCASIEDTHDGLSGDPILARQFVLRESSGGIDESDLGDVLLCEFGGSSARSARLPFLAELVGDVLFLCSEEQVIRLNATGNVALVADLQTVGDGAEVKTPGHAVSDILNTIVADDAVTAATSVPSPQPASTVSLSGFCPEFLFKCSPLPRSWFAHATKDTMSAAALYLRIASRGFVMVCLVSANTVHLSTGHLGPAAAGGFFISMLWWSNSSKHREDVPYAGMAYGVGAGLGTLTGATLARYLGG
jgi:hypothetical protein